MCGRRHVHGWLWTGIVLVVAAGCHDDRQKVRHRDEGRGRRTAVHANVDVNRADLEYVDADAAETAVVERPTKAVIVEREAPPPVVVRRRTVVVHEAPPPVIVERRAAPPPGLHIWVEGHWRHDGHRYVWASGRYERVRHGHRYVQPRWVHVQRGWEFHVGHWE